MRKAFFIVLILASSCFNDKREKMVYYLTDDSKKYWDVVYCTNFYDKCKSLTYPHYCYCFDNKGYHYAYEYEGKTRKLRDLGDIFIDPRWELLSDTLFMMGRRNYKIEKLTPDSFIFVYGVSQRFVFARSMIK